MQKISKYLVDNLALLVVAVGVVAVINPRLLSWVGPYISIMLGIVMFGMGMTLSVNDFRNVLKHPWQAGIGVLAQFLIMPLVALGLVKLFNQFYQAIIPFEPLAGLEPATFSLQVSGSTN